MKKNKVTVVLLSTLLLGNVSNLSAHARFEKNDSDRPSAQELRESHDRAEREYRDKQELISRLNETYRVFIHNSNFLKEHFSWPSVLTKYPRMSRDLYNQIMGNIYYIVYAQSSNIMLDENKMTELISTVANPDGSKKN